MHMPFVTGCTAAAAAAPQDIASVFRVYAKYGHDRADMFVALARCIQEQRLRPLGDKQVGDWGGAVCADMLVAFV